MRESGGRRESKGEGRWEVEVGDGKGGRRVKDWEGGLRMEEWRRCVNWKEERWENMGEKERRKRSYKEDRKKKEKKNFRTFFTILNCPYIFLNFFFVSALTNAFQFIQLNPKWGIHRKNLTIFIMALMLFYVNLSVCDNK